MSRFYVEVIHQPEEGTALVDIVLLHGLDGDAVKTWTHENGECWPTWLAEEFPNLRILSISHPSEKFASIFENGGMDLLERSRATLSALMGNDVGSRPTIFVGHSLGGLVVKAALRKASDLGGDDNTTLIENTIGIVFLATPHRGSGLANILGLLPGASDISKDLEKGNNHLDDLADWYVANSAAKSRRTLAFYETFKYRGVLVVDKQSADPSTPGDTPTPVDANHVEICKFVDQEDPTYQAIRNFVLKRFGVAGVDPVGEWSLDDLENYTSSREDDRKSLEEKLRSGGRDYEIDDASREKERIAKLLARDALSQTQRENYKALLSSIRTRFRMHVKPHIEGKVSQTDVNQKIQQKVIDPIVTSENLPSVTEADVHASIYYLTGNCHIDWGDYGDD